MSEKAPQSNQVETPGAGMRLAEERAQATIDKNAIKKSQETDNERHYQAIEDRITGGDVQGLNDTAQMEIYGSGSHTYHDPSSGEVIASPDKPTKGKLEDIRENPKYGKTKAEREKAAKAYEQDITALMDEDGFELVQAKLVMDMREKDKEAKIKLAGQLELNGMSPKESRQQAQERYDHLDKERRDTIKAEGIFTKDEYKRVKFGGGDYLYGEDGPNGPDDDGPDDDGGPKDPKTDPKGPEGSGGLDITGLPRSEQAFVIARGTFDYKPTPKGASDEVKQEIKEYNEDNIALLQKFGQITDDYTHLQGLVDAAHTRGHLHLEVGQPAPIVVLDSHRVRFDKETQKYVPDPVTERLDRNPKKALKQAEILLEQLRVKYEAQRALVDGRIMQNLIDHGFSPNDISDEMLFQAAGTTNLSVAPNGITVMNGKQRQGESGLTAHLTGKFAREEVRDDFNRTKLEDMNVGKKIKVEKWMGRSSLLRTIAKPFSHDARFADRIAKKDFNEFHGQLAEVDRRQEENHLEQQIRIGQEYEQTLQDRDASQIGGQKRIEYIFDPKNVTSAHIEGATRSLNRSDVSGGPIDEVQRVREEQQSSVPSPNPVPSAPGNSAHRSPETGSEDDVTRLMPTVQNAAIGQAYGQLVNENGGTEPGMHDVIARANSILERAQREADAARSSSDDEDDTEIMPSRS